MTSATKQDSEASESSDEDQEDQEDPSTTNTTGRKRVSVKDFALLVTLATIAASGLVTAVFGYDALVEKCTKLELWDILIIFGIFALLIGTFTYILLRVAAHYIVYLGIGVLLHLVFPVHPQKAKKHLDQVFSKKDKTK